MKYILLFLVALFLSTAHATPKKIEMIFLSPHKVSQLLKIIDKQDANKMYSFLAENANDNCIPMGDGCFHPQYGYLDKKPNVPVKIKEEPAKQESAEAPVKVNTFNAIETNLINCDKGNYFDIYCGKAHDEKVAQSEIEIWFDISSSLKQVDYSKDPNFCNRRSFMGKVKDSCKDKVKVSVYNTSLKEVGDYSSVCMAYGTNDEKKLVQWMKDSQAKHLILVTDIDEMSRAMRDFLDENGAKYIGDGVKPFTSSDLVEYAKELTKQCSKN